MSKAEQLFEQIIGALMEDTDRFTEAQQVTIRKYNLENETIASVISLLRSKKKMLINIYETKFGRCCLNAEINTSERNVAEATRFWKEEEKTPFIFNDNPGFFAKKPKKENYKEALEYIEILIQHYTEVLKNNEVQILNESNIQEIIEEYSELVGRLEERLEGIKGEESISSNSWSDMGEIYIGDILEPIEVDENSSYLAQRTVELLDAKNALCDKKEWIKRPLTHMCNTPFTLFIDYEYSSDRQKIDDGRFAPLDLIRSILYQIMMNMPPYTYMIDYFDAGGAGKNLGELHRLSSVVNGNAYSLHDEIFQNTFRLMHESLNLEEMRENLSKLNQYICDVNKIRCGESVVKYNQKYIEADGSIQDSAEFLPLRFIIFENMSHTGESSIVSQMETLINNAKECGISIIILSQRMKGQMMNSLEKQLVDGKIIDVLKWESETSTDWCQLDVMASSLGKKEQEQYHFTFEPYGQKENNTKLLDAICQKYMVSLEVETRIEKIMQMDKLWASKDGSVEIEIPVGINERGLPSYISIGGPAGAHALLAGESGCGKSSLLHTIINSIILCYSPMDVQIWLSDYKANEFSRYAEATPPHIRYVSTDRTMEYTFHFLEKIYNEYQRRVDLFGSITSVKEYREKNGKDSLPRILVIIDEFHVMSNHANAEPIYKEKLTSILREARSVGITMLFADQTCGVGLKGLSEDGKKQLTCRMAMKTSSDEYKAVFDITSSNDVIPTIKPHEIVLKRNKDIFTDAGKKETRIYYEHSKTIYVDIPVREDIVQRSIEKYGNYEAEIVDNNKRIPIDWNVIREDKISARRDEVMLYIGIPLDLNKFMKISLVPNYSENIMSIGEDMQLQADLLFHMVKSIQQSEEPYQIILMAGEYDMFYGTCEKKLEQLAAEDENINLVIDECEMCENIDSLVCELQVRWKQRRPSSRIYVFWLGLDDLSKNFDHFGSKPQRQDASSKVKDTPKILSKQEMLDKEFMDLFSDVDYMLDMPGEDHETDDREMDEEFLYNANDDITSLMKEGSKKSIHNIVFLSSFRAAKQANCVSSIYDIAFKHKIAFRMGKDDAGDYLGRSSLIQGMDGSIINEDTAVYYDGMNARRFVPYLS